MGRGVQASPWVYSVHDYQFNSLSITVTFDASTRALQTITVFRDAACIYTKIYVGLGSDGRPDSTPRAFSVPAGTHTFTAAQLASVGLNTIEDILAFQITAGP